MNSLTAVFSLLVAAAGWYYLFSSRAAQKLAPIEDRAINTRRVVLRRVGGAMMMLLAVGFYMGFNSVSEETPRAFLAIWCAVFFLLAAIVVLAIIDLRLTWKLRHAQRGRPLK